jgi:hypothetical protein
MENLDRLDAAQAEWEVKKMYVNTVRVQTLDRFYNQKVANEQREIHNIWAPHRRAKREFHDYHDRFEAELDSMPMKELKKVLTPAVLHGDRDAIRNITQRIQREETWKSTWKEMERHRHDDTLSDLEERMTYNAMLCDLAGQPVRQRDPNRKLPNNCSERMMELARPKAETKIDDVTKLTDFRGLVHVDHQVALEARFPGHGHEMSKTFREKASSSASPGWPPPNRPETPDGPLKKRSGNAKDSRNVSLKKGSVPASAHTLTQAVSRITDDDLMQQAVEQFNNLAPPAPDQTKILRETKIINDADVMSEMLSQSLHGSGYVSPSASIATSAANRTGAQKIPPVRSMVYPVLVETAEKTDVARIMKSTARLGGHLDSAASTLSGGGTSSARRKPGLPRRDVKIARLGINLVSASGIRGADRSGLSDPYCVVRIPGRPKSKYSTRILKATLNPVWRESCEIQEFFAGDALEFAVFDKDVHGHECLGKACITQEMILPDGVAGDLELFDEKRPEEGAILRIKVVVLENFDPDGRLQAKAVRGAEDSDDEAPPVGEACRQMHEFEAALRPVPRLGNFWMTPRGDMKKAACDGGAMRRISPGRGQAVAEDRMEDGYS